MQTAQASTAPPAASATRPGTWPRVEGVKRVAEEMKVRISWPGGPIRTASQAPFCTAAISAPTAMSTYGESVRAATARASAKPPIIPAQTPARVRARAA